MHIFKCKTVFSIICISALSACSSSERASLSSQALIETPQGWVQGVSTQDEGIYNFKGLPFAAPPVGELRWAAPQPAPKWAQTRMADQFGNRCMQPDSEGDYFDRLIEGHGLGPFKNFLIKRYTAAQKPSPMSEDCLYLNVRSGNIANIETQNSAVAQVAGKKASGKKAVMVWIHGGGHSFGSGDFAYYQSNGLVEKDVVLVTLNYRLGAFGYMSHPALSADDENGVSGNYGTLDQIAALEWVRDNIDAYGGDPENVTIFGESAGAWSVTELMASPLAQGLFHKAIAQSGASSYHMIQMSDDSPYDGQGWPSGYSGGIAAAKAFGLENPSAADLRAISAEDILEKLPEDSYDSFHHQRDGYVFPKNVGLAFNDGDINAVPFMTGYNADEGSLFFPNDPQPSVWVEDLKPGSRAQITAGLREAFPSQASNIVELYRLDQDFTTGGTAMMGDEIFGTNIKFAARMNEAAGMPSYVYHFSRVPPSPKQTIGAFHAAEISFVFDSNVEILGLTEDDERLTEHMTHYWTNFAKTGNPNLHSPNQTSLPNWPRFNGQNWMHFSGNTGRDIAKVETGLRQAKLKALTEGLDEKLGALKLSNQTSISGENVTAQGGVSPPN